MFLLKQNDVRSQDTVGVIVGLTGSVEGRKLAWKFVQDQWDELHRRFPGLFLLSRLVAVSITILTMTEHSFRTSQLRACRSGQGS